MNRTLKLATAALLALVVVVALTLTLLTDSPETMVVPDDGPPKTQSAIPNHSIDGLTADQYPSTLVSDDQVEIPDTLPDSLDGTEVPKGWAKTDVNGSLIATPELRELFEYYLAALGEETLPQLVARIEMTLSQLAEPARSEAIEILGNYLDYKLELGALEAGATEALASADDMQQQLIAVQSLRRQWLDAETADAFFAAEEAVDEFQLEQMRIRNDESLTEDERAQRLRQAEETLPAPIREARRETRKFSEYEQVRQELGNDPEALNAWRRENFGPEAAERLKQAEAEQQAWEARWQAYRAERAELASGGLAGPELEAAIDRLRDQYFEGTEKVRAEALDSIQ